MTTTAHYQNAADVLDGWRDDVLTGKAPVIWPIGTGELARVEIGPGMVTLIGGAPGSGKTAATMQFVVDALRLTPTLRALVCNIEMPPAVLLDRQLARLSGVDLTTIRHRRLRGEHADRIDQGIHTLEAIADRLVFVRPPFDLTNVAAVADAHHADLILLDYIQRIAPPGDHGDKRGSVNATMDYLRQFADAGVAVIVVSAVTRSKDSHGRSSYAGSGLNLASFRESSELEFGCDDAFILHPANDDAEGEVMRLKHLKSRHGEARDIWLRFERSIQRFTPTDPPNQEEETPRRRREPKGPSKAERAKLTATLQALWNNTPPAPVGDDDPHDDDGGDE